MLCRSALRQAPAALGRALHAEARLAALGHTLPPVGAPKGSYRLTQRSGDLVFTVSPAAFRRAADGLTRREAGHLPIDLDGTLRVGKVGQDVTVDEAHAAVRPRRLHPRRLR